MSAVYSLVGTANKQFRALDDISIDKQASASPKRSGRAVGDDLPRLPAALRHEPSREFHCLDLDTDVYVKNGVAPRQARRMSMLDTGAERIQHLQQRQEAIDALEQVYYKLRRRPSFSVINEKGPLHYGDDVSSVGDVAEKQLKKSSEYSESEKSTVSERVSLIFRKF